MPSDELLRLLDDQNGVVTWKQARAAGHPERALRAGHGGGLTRVQRGVYAATAAYALAPHAHAVAAARLLSRVDLVGVAATAAVIAGLPLLGRPPDRPELAERREERPRHHGRSRVVRPDECVTGNAVPITVPARTAVDVARVRGFRAGLVTADAVLARGGTREQLSEVLDRSVRWPGLAVARRVVEHADGRSETALESLGRARFIEHGLPPCDLQVVLGDADGPIGRVDHYWPEHGTVAEGDGALKYTDATALFEEKRREDRLREAGFEVVRYTWDEALRHPEMVVARILRAFARHAARRAAA